MENMDKFYLTHGTITDGNSLFIEDGAMQIDNGKMTWIGPEKEMEDPQGFEIDMGGRILIPGLINPPPPPLLIFCHRPCTLRGNRNLSPDPGKSLVAS